MTLSRRQFLTAAALTTVGAAAAACVVPSDGTGTPPAQPVGNDATPAAPAGSGAGTGAGQYKEAPMLAARVANGELPPVEERVSDNPCVCPTPHGIGHYGGNIRRAFNGVADRWGIRKIPEVALVFYNEDMTLRPEMCESWQYDDDGTEVTIKMRPGMRWSNGDAFSTEDVRFWFEDCVLVDGTLAAGEYDLILTGPDKVRPELTIIDENTFAWNFPYPHPLYVEMACRYGPYHPSEYMKQFHTKHADPAELSARVKEAGFDTWEQLYIAKNEWWLEPERPTLYPLIPRNTMRDELFIMERNPYFAEVDADGQQLPYIDTMTHRLFETPDTFNMWVVNGEIDWQARHVDVGNYTVFKEGEAGGGYHTILGVGAKHVCLLPNHTVKDERLRAFFQDLNVRKAMSYAVDRDTMNDLAFDGQTIPRQYSPLPQSANFYPKLSDAYLEYDVALANQLLDEAGYSQRDAEGFRCYKDGTGDTVFFSIEGYLDPGSPWEDCVQMVVQYLAEVGIKAAYKYTERSLHEERFAANNVEAYFPIWNAWSLLPILDMGVFTGTRPDHGWASGWGIWKRDPSDPNAEEPPADHWIRTIWEYSDQVLKTADEAARNARFTQILDIWYENLPMIGYLGGLPALVIAKKGLQGYREDIVLDSGTTRDESICPTQVLYWDEPDQHVFVE